MRLKIELDEMATQRLVEQAVAERRPVVWQAEVAIRRALGLGSSSTPADTPPEEDSASRAGRRMPLKQNAVFVERGPGPRVGPARASTKEGNLVGSGTDQVHGSIPSG